MRKKCVWDQDINKVVEETMRTDIFRITEEMWWLIGQQVKEKSNGLLGEQLMKDDGYFFLNLGTLGKQV